MARYTMELGELLQQWSPDKNIWDLSDMADIISNGRDKLFSSAYPIWDEAYRAVLNTKIITHYFYREIGFGTPGQFMFRLAAKMQEIMPYYNQLYETQMDTSALLHDTDLKEEYIEASKGQTQEKTAEVTGEQSGHQSGSQSQTTSEGGTQSNGSTIGDVKDSGKDVLKKELDSTITHQFNSTDTTSYGKIDTKSGSDTDINSGDLIDRYSETPQGALTGLKDDSYLTNANIQTDDRQTEHKYNSSNTLSGKDIITKTGDNKDIGSGSDTDTTTYGKNTNTDMHTSDMSATMDESQNFTTEQYLASKLGQRDIGRTADDMRQMGYTKTIKGRNGGNYVDEMLKLRESLLNIDMMIIKELEPLFMGIY